jgi:S1-C subfamily serine protease
MGSRRRTLLALGTAVAAAFISWASPSAAQSTPRAAAQGDAVGKDVPLGFSRLLVRTGDSDPVGIGSAEFRVRMLERMRAQGFAAVGAEDLVFGKDDTNRAAYVVGGTVKELVCRRSTVDWSCRIGVDWEVLDVARDQVVYKMTARAAVVRQGLQYREQMPGMLVDAAMDRLLARAAFRRTLATREAPADARSFAPAKLPRCSAGARVAANADDLLSRVVVVKTHKGFGSGFFVSPEGLVLTAAHVVEGDRVTLRTHDGEELTALPVRVDPRQDVALLRTERPLSGARCLPLRLDTAAGGAEVYAVGAPASLALAFSLTRGIVSGYPTVGGRRVLQTDAPVSPGNSGGPIVDDRGTALGVVSFKTVAESVEGLAFAIPMPEALGALNLRLGDATDSVLLTETAHGLDTAPVRALTDTPDGVPSLEPPAEWAEPGDAQNADTSAHRETYSSRRHGTPGYIHAIRWSGFAVGTAGLLGVLATYLEYNAITTTQTQFDGLRTWNTVSWATAITGAGAFVLSFVIRPSASTQSSLRVDPAGLHWEGAF